MLHTLYEYYIWSLARVRVSTKCSNVGITLIQMMHTNSHRVLDFAAHLECTHLHIVDLKKSFQVSIVAQLDI